MVSGQDVIKITLGQFCLKDFGIDGRSNASNWF
jgi:hypothetical protein